jgi:hypothetical protein
LSVKGRKQIVFPNASDRVVLVWGVDGWRLPTGDMLSGDSRTNDRLVMTPMTRTARGHVVELSLPTGTILDYNFKVMNSAGRLLNYDDNSGADYHELVSF